MKRQELERCSFTCSNCKEDNYFQGKREDHPTNLTCFYCGAKIINSSPREFVLELRKKTGLNTHDFGAKLGVSGRTVEGWEQGIRAPSKSVLMLMKTLL